MNPNNFILLDAGIFIGALLQDDPRHQEARPIVELARKGDLAFCTTTGILSEVYAALTWVNALPQHSPAEAAHAVRLLIEPPSAIEVLGDGFEASLRMLEIAERYHLTGRRIHDARHVATALIKNVVSVYTYDVADWEIFKPEGIIITGPPSILANLANR